MSDHLPECLVPRMNGLWGLPLHPEDAEANCICEELRACERRVRTVRDSIVFGNGYSAALKAVQEAVAAWPEYRMRDACAAAIDAVREAER